MNFLKIAGVMALASLLTACVSAPAKNDYYTLMPSASPTSDTAVAKSAGYAISVQRVALPEQVDRPQIVITTKDSLKVIPLNNSLWASPLSDEIRHALVDDLSRQLGVLDIPATAAGKLPLWKIYVNVQRFDSIYSQRAVLDATWRLVPTNLPGRKAKICRAEIQIKVADGIPALVAGQRQALHELATVIAEGISGPSPRPSVQGVQLKGCT